MYSFTTVKVIQSSGESHNSSTDFKLSSPMFSLFVPLFNVKSQQQRIKCHPQGLWRTVNVCQNPGLNLASPVRGQLSPS